MYQAEHHDVEALLTNLFGEVLAEHDPLRRYHELTRDQALHDALVSRLKQERGRALAEVVQQLVESAAEAGEPIGVVRAREMTAEAAGLGSRQRVEKLIAAASR